MNNKPIQLLIEESKEELIIYLNNLCNQKNIDYYFLELILKDIYKEIIEKKEKELIELKQKMKNKFTEEGDDNVG